MKSDILYDIFPIKYLSEHFYLSDSQRKSVYEKMKELDSIKGKKIVEKNIKINWSDLQKGDSQSLISTKQGNLSQLTLFCFFNLIRSKLKPDDFTKLIREEGLEKTVHSSVSQQLNQQLLEDISKHLSTYHFKLNELDVKFNESIKPLLKNMKDGILKIEDFSKTNTTYAISEEIDKSVKTIKQFSRKNFEDKRKLIVTIETTCDKFTTAHNQLPKYYVIDHSLIYDQLSKFHEVLQNYLDFIIEIENSFFNDENDTIDDLINILFEKDAKRDKIRRVERITDNLSEIKDILSTSRDNSSQMLIEIEKATNQISGKINYENILFAFIAINLNIIYSNRYYELHNYTIDMMLKDDIENKHLPLKFTPDKNFLKNKVSKANLESLATLTDLNQSLMSFK